MIQSFDDTYPHVPSSAFVHSTAVLIGEVELGKNVSVWPGAVLRGDLRRIIIGDNSNVQDNTVIHTGKYNTVVGENVMIGHNVTLHSCDIGSRCLIGMGSIIIDGAKIGDNCIIGAGTLIPPSTVIPDGSVVMGNPYKIKRYTTDDEMEYILDRCANYKKVADEYKRSARIL